MEKMQIGTSDVWASPLVHGCMRMASLSLEEAVAVLETTAEVGIDFYDHADIYGGGQSETLFAKALKASTLSRDQVILQSKVGIRKGFFDFSKDHILKSVDGILERLQTDYLDFLLLHRPDSLMEPQEVAQAFDQLHADGKVKHFGVSNQNPGQIELLKTCVDQPLVINQLQFGPAHTPLIDQGLNVNMLNSASVDHSGGLLEYSRINKMTIQPWSPFQVDLGQGLFMDHPDYQTLTTTIELYAKEAGVSFEAMVLAWILRHPAQMQPIIGSMNPQRIKAMAQASHIKMTRETWYDIYKAGGRILP
ncbi:TPA: aldo/keto reductase family oxidoreductase [Streptococcus suis]